MITILNTILDIFKDSTEINGFVSSNHIYIEADIPELMKGNTDLINISYAEKPIGNDSSGLNDQMYYRKIFNIEILFLINKKNRTEVLLNSKGIYNFYQVLFDTLINNQNLNNQVDGIVNIPSLDVDVLPPIVSGTLYKGGGLITISYYKDIIY